MSHLPFQQRPSFSPSSSSSSTSSTASVATPIDIPPPAMASFDFGYAAAPMPSPSLESHQQFFAPLAPQAHHFNTPYGSSPETSVHAQAPQAQQPRYNLRSQAAKRQQQQMEPTFSSPFATNAQSNAIESQHFRQNSFSSNQIPSRQSSTSSTSSEAYLRDFTLLAEADKRAQMACVTRDLEEMEF